MTRDAPTAAARAPAGTARAGTSSATPVANAAADAAWPDGNDVLCGVLLAELSGKAGRVRPTSRLARTFADALAMAMPARPRRAARRVHLFRRDPRPAATAIHSMPWSA